MTRYVKFKEPTERTPEPWTPEDYGMTFDSQLDLERACACINFCRGIPTEWMQGKVAKTIQVSVGERPEDGWRCLSDIPDLIGLIPVCKEPT